MPITSRLADVIKKTGRFLDPIIAVVGPRSGFQFSVIASRL
jgi:hypothetical protein